MNACNCRPRFLLNGTVSHAPTCPLHPDYEPCCEYGCAKCDYQLRGEKPIRLVDFVSDAPEEY